MPTVSELLAPLPAPAERAPRRAHAAAQDDAPRFADSLENEKAERTAREPRRDGAREADASSRGEEAASTPKTEAATAASEGPAQGDVADASGASAQDDLPTDDEAESERADPAALLAGLLETGTLAEPVATLTAITPPPAQAGNAPGGLARWFATASAPVVPGPALPANAMGGKLADPAALSGAAHAAGTLAQPAVAGSQVPSFADALASTALSSGSDGQGLDALVTQALGKAAASLETTMPGTPTLATGQSLATGAQPGMTGVPQAATGQAVPVTALAVEITRQAMNGKTQFDIRLDPPELGRLSVRLEMDASGQTRTHMIVERAETLDMLSTDVRSLERALQQAGLKSDPGSVSFELARDATDGFGQSGQRAGGEDRDGRDESGAGPSNSLEGLGDGEFASPEAIRQQISITGHLDVRV